MNKVFLFSITVLLATSLSISCAAPTPVPTSTPTSEPAIPAHFTTYTEENLFSISYPPDWETAMSVIPGLEEVSSELLKDMRFDIPLKEYSMIFFAGRPYEEVYNPIVNIIVGPALGSTLDEEFEAQLRGVTTNVENYHKFNQIKTTIGGREAIIIDHTYTVPGLIPTRQLQMLILVDKVSWTVTVQTLTEELPFNQETLNQVIRSLRIYK